MKFVPTTWVNCEISSSSIIYYMYNYTDIKNIYFANTLYIYLHKGILKGWPQGVTRKWSFALGPPWPSLVLIYNCEQLIHSNQSRGWDGRDWVHVRQCAYLKTIKINPFSESFYQLFWILPLFLIHYHVIIDYSNCYLKHRTLYIQHSGKNLNTHGALDLRV